MRKSLEQRYWPKVDVRGPDECWPWRGANTGVAAGGHGLLWDGTHRPSGAPRFVKAHRLAWTLAHGDPGPMKVLHRCDNPPCQNPAHLFLGTQADNIADMRAKGRERHRGLAGETHNLAKLTASQINEIRSRSTGERGEQRRLADEYGVCHQQISRILNGKRWTA